MGWSHLGHLCVNCCQKAPFFFAQGEHCAKHGNCFLAVLAVPVLLVCMCLFVVTRQFVYQSHVSVRPGPRACFGMQQCETYIIATSNVVPLDCALKDLRCVLADPCDGKDAPNPNPPKLQRTSQVRVCVTIHAPLRVKVPAKALAQAHSRLP